jgi:hypothetical protein
MKVLLMTLVLVLLLAGCAAGQGDAGRSPSEDSVTDGKEETTVYEEETTVLAGPGGIPRPPESTLSYGGQEVKASLGSYCWWGDLSGGCADMFDIPIPPEQRSLAVPSGSEMVFHYGGQSSPKMGEVKAYPRNKLHKKRQDLHPPHRSLQARGSGVEWTIPAKLPPGDYVVDVYVEEPPDNQVGYYFRVMVE